MAKRSRKSDDELDLLPTPCGPEIFEDDDGDGEEGPRGLHNWWHAPVREDPWGRWPAGAEPARELEIVRIDADASQTLLIRNALIEVEPGVIPDPRHDYEDNQAYFDLQCASRWNATWRGARLAALSLDMFSKNWPEVLRLTFDPGDPVDLLCAYHASYPGISGIYLCNHGTPLRNARDEPLGHQVDCRDPRLALRIGARYPGVATHAAFLQRELWNPKEPGSKRGRELMANLRAAAKSVSGESVPGAHAAMQDEQMQSLACLLVGEFEPPPNLTDPMAASLDTFTLIGAGGLQELAEARLVRADRQIVDGLAAHVTYSDAVSAIRRSDPDRLPLWIDFTDSDGEPKRRRHGAGIEQPLYGALVTYDETEDEAGPFHAVVPVGRTDGLVEEQLPLCALGIGPDDAWRFPTPQRKISVLTAHSGGVVVRHVSVDWSYEGVQPPIEEHELDRELARSVQRTSEWVLARVGAVLTALDDGLLVLQRVGNSTRTYDLVRAPRLAARTRAAPLPDAMAIAARLRELGSLHRVAEADCIDATAAYEALELAGVDPDQVLRDEVLLRWRRTASVEAVVGSTRLQRDLVERYLLEAGIDADDTPVPHDVTDPDVLAAITAYRQTGTLEAAGERVGVSGETVRRRIARAGLAVEEIESEAQRRAAQETLDAWEHAGRSLAGAARELSIDPRTVKERLRRAGVPAAVIAEHAGEDRSAEVVTLHRELSSPQAVAAVLGMPVRSVRRLLALAGEDDDRAAALGQVSEESDPSPLQASPSDSSGSQSSLGRRAPGSRGGRPRVSDAELDDALAAVKQCGSVRAAARALGLSVGGMAYRLQLARARSQGQARSDTSRAGAEPEGR